jgi:hypothetical protein
LILEFNDPSNNIDSENEDGDHAFDEVVHELWHFLTGSDFHQDVELVKTEQEWNECKLAHQAEQELNVSGVSIKQVEDIESSFDAEHQTPDEAEEAYEDAVDLLSELLCVFGEPVQEVLHEEVDESEDGVDSEADAHSEEDHRKEILPWHQSEQGWEHHEEQVRA